MKKTLFLSACAVAALAFAGCAKDATEDGFTANPGDGSATVTAVIEPLTRTTLDDPQDGKSRVLWSVGDEIGVIASDGTIHKAVLTDGAGTETASFTVEGGVEGETYAHAFYPYVYNGDTQAKTTADGSALTLRLPAYQTYDADAVFSTATNTMVASVGSDGRLSFKSVMGCFELKIKGSQVVRGITVKNSKTKVSGKASVALDTKELSLGTTNESFSFAYLECPEPVQLSDAPTSFYVLVPEGSYDCLQVGVMTDDGSYVRTATSVHSVNRAAIKPIDCGNLDDMIDTSSAVDLSADGWANCYIVEPKGGEQVYSFDTKFVDGTDVVNDEVNGDDKSLAYAQMLWAEDLKIAYDIRFDKAAGKIYFKYDGYTPGNARIVVCNDMFASAAIAGGVKTVQNSVAWGWHIWATEAPGMGIAADGNAIKDHDGNGTITPEEVASSTRIGLMDRNLGATWVPASLDEIENITEEQAAASTGCFYQLGNVHPYPRVKTFGWNTDKWQNVATEYCYGYSQYTQDWANSNAAKTNVMNNVMFPFYKYTCTYIPNGPHKGVDSKYTNTQWLKADFVGGNDAGNSAGDMALWGGQGPKTNYDPCPAGWVVPHQGNMYQMATGAPKSINGGASAGCNLQFYKLGPQLGSGYAGSYVSYDGGKTFDWHPFSGYMGNGNVGNSGVRAYYWGCPYYSSAKDDHNMGVYAICGSVSNATTGFLDNAYTSPWYSAATGYQIRCVKRN